MCVAAPFLTPKCFVPFQFGTRPLDALFRLDAEQTGIAIVDLASDPQKAPMGSVHRSFMLLIS
jgi:hypothetical protein